MTVTTTERLRAMVDGVVPGGPDELPPLTPQLVRSLPNPADLPEHLSIAEVAEVTGISAHTLRYYERIGLLAVPRDASGRRVYDHESLGRLVFVSRLRASDMPIAAISRYIALVVEGPHTEPERLALLEEHRRSIRHRLEELHAALAIVDYKIVTYGGACGSGS